jgi:glucose dehydrogenase
MTPHDEWDYDGINEMPLVDQKIDGKERKLLVHFDRNGYGYTLDRETGELLVAQHYDPAVNWSDKVEMDKASPMYGRPYVNAKYSTEHGGEDVNTKGICPAAFGFLAQDRPVLRADEPCLHGLRALQGELHPRSTLRRCDPLDVSRAEQPWRHG